MRAPVGHISIFGHDPVLDPAARVLIGLAPQEIHLDRFLSARDMLAYHGRYFGMKRAEAEAADELLNSFDLIGKAQSKPQRLSGGIEGLEKPPGNGRFFIAPILASRSNPQTM